MTKIFVNDDDSHRAVYVGEIAGDPPRRLELANSSVDSAGQTRVRGARTYRLSTQSDDTATYEEVRK